MNTTLLNKIIITPAERWILEADPGVDVVSGDTGGFVMGGGFVIGDDVVITGGGGGGVNGGGGAGVTVPVVSNIMSLHPGRSSGEQIRQVFVSKHCF